MRVPRRAWGNPADRAQIIRGGLEDALAAVRHERIWRQGYLRRQRKRSCRPCLSMLSNSGSPTRLIPFATNQRYGPISGPRMSAQVFAGNFLPVSASMPASYRAASSLRRGSTVSASPCGKRHLAEADPLQTDARSGIKGQLTKWSGHPCRLLGDNSSRTLGRAGFYVSTVADR